MNEETNHMNPADQDKKLPPALDKQLRDLLPEKELNNFRKQLPDEFLNDASEGLDQVRDGNQLEDVLKKLNQQMHQHLTYKKRKPGARSIGDFKDFNWAYWAIIIILVLCICAFLIIRLLLHHK
jgi:hypothetical protein